LVGRGEGERLLEAWRDVELGRALDVLQPDQQLLRERSARGRGERTRVMRARRSQIEGGSKAHAGWSSGGAFGAEKR
jgi:hypothetical protein